MKRLSGERIIGVETEFGCWANPDRFAKPEDAVELVKNHVFYEMGLGLLDLHARDDVFEPARSGGFLVNGGRLYIDAVGSHLEYATAESRTLTDLIANDRAGQRIIAKAVRDLSLENEVKFYNNSVDHFGGHTFGCHENYLVRMEPDFFEHRVHYLVPFLVSRQVFAGAGRVGGHRLIEPDREPLVSAIEENPIDYVWVSGVYGIEPDESVEFQLSQRADHILKVIASRVRFNRAIINPKWEHFYSIDEFQRLHILYGEANQCEYAYALKCGTTSLVLQLIEEGLERDDLLLLNPVKALKSFSRDPSLGYQAPLALGGTTSAIEIQFRYLELCQKFRKQGEMQAWILDQWEGVLTALTSSPEDLIGKIDWVTKRWLLDQYREEQGIDALDDACHSLDLEYHDIDSEASLFYAIESVLQTTLNDKLMAMAEAPKNTRAWGRAKVVQALLKQKSRPNYSVDWNGVAIGRGSYISLEDPYNPYDGAADQLL